MAGTRRDRMSSKHTAKTEVKEGRHGTKFVQSQRRAETHPRKLGRY